jgi:O-antigen ligase
MSRFRPPLNRPPSVSRGAVATEVAAATYIPAKTATASSKAATTLSTVVPAIPPQPTPQTERQGLALALLGLYVLMYTVPIAELATVSAHFYVPILPVVGVLLTVALISTQRVGRFWQTRMAFPWMGLLVCFLLAAVLGTWPRVSTSFILQYGLRFHVLPFYACAFLMSTRQVRYCMYWVCGGALLLLSICLFAGRISDDGRFYVLPETSLANPNDLAFWLMLGTTFLVLLFFSRSIFLRVAAAVSIPLSAYFILRTASRANFVTMIALVAVVFLIGSRTVKMSMMVALPVLAILLAIVIPKSTLARLTLIVSDPERVAQTLGSRDLESAADSQAARTELQKRAISLTLQHPLLGVGANMFEEGVETMVRASTGRKSGWQVAHNTYLEVSAENGIPALIFYLWIMLLCLRMNYVAYRACLKQGAGKLVIGQSFCLLLMTLGYYIGIFFNTMTYDPHLDVLVALSAANFLALRRELNFPKSASFLSRRATFQPAAVPVSP